MQSMLAVVFLFNKHKHATTYTVGEMLALRLWKQPTCWNWARSSPSNCHTHMGERPLSAIQNFAKLVTHEYEELKSELPTIAYTLQAS